MIFKKENFVRGVERVIDKYEDECVGFFFQVNSFFCVWLYGDYCFQNI